MINNFFIHLEFIGLRKVLKVQTLSLFFGIICIDELLTISAGKVNGKNFDFRVD